MNARFRRALVLVTTAGAAPLLAGCPGPAAHPPASSCLPAPMRSAATAATYAFSLATSGDWARFEREAAMPHDQLVALARASSNRSGFDPEQLFAMNRRDLASGFQQVAATAAAPLWIDSIRDDARGGAPMVVVHGRYRLRSGGDASVQIKLVWVACRFYVGYLG